MVSRWSQNRRNRWAGAAGLALALALVLGFAAWWARSPSVAVSPPRARQYTAQSVCLLTPPAGLADAAAAQAWAGLEDVSAKSHVQVRYLAVVGVDSPGADGPFLASLVSQGCQAVVVSGDAEIQAAEAEAARFPGTKFLLLGQSVARDNLLGISYPHADAARSATAAAVGHLVAS
ncbi:hypothetical protein [Streptacidiphilus sp. EB103A]|uniref:hypothetical protein n=1 Tax=Streptacidiphilus sp. EB103A TaxID=3156275 RepID=UPI00351791D4